VLAGFDPFNLSFREDLALIHWRQKAPRSEPANGRVPSAYG
jgi:hypothetical protein